MFAYGFSDIQAQLDTLPLWLRLWFGWMGLVILVAPFVFLRRRQGRVAAAFSIVFLVIQLPLLHSVGLTNLLALPHLLFWVPLLVYLGRELRDRRVPIRSAIGAWMSVTVVTLIVTLVVDLRDFGRWLAGERGLIDPGPGVELPWFTIPAIVIAFAVAGWTIFGPSEASD
jgi:hypothetical protein